jgi:hypothetical protein
LAQNRLVEGEKVARDAAEKCSSVLGREHIDTLNIECNLVRILFGKGQFGEAESLGKKVMSMSEKYSGSSHQFATIKALLGRIHLAQGLIEEGRLMFQKAAQDALVNFGEDSRVTKEIVGEHTMLVEDLSRMRSEDVILKWGPLWHPNMDGGQP